MNGSCSAASEYHISITRSMGSAAHHYYDSEVGEPLKEPLNDTFKNAEKLRPVSVLSQISHLVSLQNKTTKALATIPYSHHVATQRVEKSANLRDSVSPLEALPLSLGDPLAVDERQGLQRFPRHRRHIHAGVSLCSGSVKSSLKWS